MVFVNFDELPFFFDPCGDCIYNEKGSKEVAIITHRQSKTRVSVMPAICSNGHYLPPLFVFIYKPSQSSDHTFPKKYEHLKNRRAYNPEKIMSRVEPNRSQESAYSYVIHNSYSD